MRVVSQGIVAINQLQNYNQSTTSTYLDQHLVGKCAAITTVRSLIHQVAPTDSNVLLLGESGTGKEVIARGLHDCSPRARGPFIPINCGAIPADLLESELFGHEKGAFTGAVNSHPGRFELAEGGTLFLDEIGDMPLEMQVKLLRVLQERTFERVGAKKSLKCDVRVIAATHQNLEEQVEAGGFRMDLYYRLNVFPIEVPPLREREGDVDALVNSFIAKFEAEQRGSIRLLPDAMAHLRAYEWPGNVRELANLIERLIILYPDSEVHAIDLPPKYLSDSQPIPPNPDAEGAIADLFSPASQAPHDDAPTTEAGEVQAAEVEVAEPGAVEGAEREDLSGLFAPPRLDLHPAPIPSSRILDLDEPLDLKAHLVEVEKGLITLALEKSDWVNATAAKLLMLQRTTLVEKMRKYGIHRPK